VVDGASRVERMARARDAGEHERQRSARDASCSPVVAASFHGRSLIGAWRRRSASGDDCHALRLAFRNGLRALRRRRCGHRQPSRSTMQIATARKDMRDAYCGGAPGILVSGTAWLVAALVAASDPQRAVWTLFVGGMLISPLADLLCRALGRSARHARDNPLGPFAYASVAWLILSLPLAWAVSRLQLAWFFPAMLLVIGGRYLGFAPMFGLSVYWILGAALAAAGYVLVFTRASPFAAALTGAALELAFAAVVFAIMRRESPAPLRAAPPPG
jgi:hypothetical protein